MKFLIIGGTSFFGKRVVDRLLARGDDVTIFSRGRRRPPFWDRVTHLRGDRTDHRAFIETLHRRTFDAVIDNIAFEREDVEAVVTALQDRIGHYLLTSSGAVYPDFEPPRAFRPITEDDADLSLRGDMAYAEGKRSCEQALHEAATFPFTIVRPPIVQGPDDASGRGWFWIQRVADGGAVLVPQRYPAIVWRQAYSDDVAQVFLRAAGNPVAYGKTYNVAMDEIVTLDDFVRTLATVLNRPDPVVLVAEKPLKKALPWYRPTFTNQFILDTTNVKRDLAFTSTPLSDWIGTTARWHSEARLQPSRGYERRREEISFAEQIR